ncbi:FAD:protein FMN transferase [bacterium]|nr:FAD:protein FMN transferase [bacterium]MBU1990164.1 FAD:protein FMN transferase [bacterium]
MKVAMGTFISISIDESKAELLEPGFEIIKDIELSLSSYDSNAQIFKLNNTKKSFIDNYTYEALKLSEKYYVQTGGYFDITVGSITKDLYRFGEDERIPSSKELYNATINFKGLFFNTQEAYIDDNIKLDLGGMGKGYAVDKVVEYFKSKHTKKAIVSASGDIRCLDRCHIDIQSPYSESFLASFDTLKYETGITTSGNYKRYVKSTKNNHLINPKRKKPAQNFLSITLVSTISNSDLDAYATAVSVMPKEKAYSFLDSINVAYILLESNNKLIVSKNINRFVENLKMH